MTVTDKIPEAVTLFLALEGDSIKPETRDRLRRFDYDELGIAKLTVQHVRKLAAVLDSGVAKGDDR